MHLVSTNEHNIKWLNDARTYKLPQRILYQGGKNIEQMIYLRFFIAGLNCAFYFTYYSVLIHKKRRVSISQI